MWNLGYVCGLILLSASSSTGHVQLVYLNGKHIPIRKITLCFADRYNVTCKDGWFAPIQNTFGFKDPDRTKTCTNQVPPYPRQCCVINSTDCAFTSIKDFNQLRDTCSGKMKCVGQPAPQHAIWSSHPQMEERCPAQERLTSSAIATTQYVTTEYACIPLPSRQKICSSSSQSGKGLFLVSPDYPDYQPESAGYKCSCHVNVSGNTKLTVAALDLRLCDSKDGCGRSLTLGNDVITDTNMVERDASFSGFTGLKQIYSHPLNGYMNITLQNVDPKDSLHIWLYLYAEGSTITSVCDKETAITTTRTTTRTSTTRTTTRTSTTSTTTRTSTTSTPTRTSTTSTPTRTSTTPTTPLTTTANKSASSIKQSLTSSNSTPLKITISSHATLKSNTACYNFYLIVDPPCANNEMLLPVMFVLGITSDSVCHNLISTGELHDDDDNRRCCKQRLNDKITNYSLPSMKSSLPGYDEFINVCTGRQGQGCTSSHPIQNSHGEDYATFQFACIENSSVLRMKHNGIVTGREVYLYNDQNDGEAKVNCMAYTSDCLATINIEIVANHVSSTKCSMALNDGRDLPPVDCKNLPVTPHSSPVSHSRANFMKMSIFMTVDPARAFKEFLWIKVTATTNSDVTVGCGTKVLNVDSIKCSRTFNRADRSTNN